MAVVVKKPTPKPEPKRDLPRVERHDGNITVEQVETMQPSEALRLILHIKRQRSVVAELDKLENAASERLMKHFNGLPEEDRGRLDAGEAGFATYVGPGDVEYVADIEALLKDMSPEEINTTYKPDIKSLKQVLDGKRLKEHLKTKRSRSPSLRFVDKGGPVE